MAFVIEGVPSALEEPREWDSIQYGPQRRMGFRVVNPALPEKAGAWQELFECSNALIELVQAAAVAGKPVRMVGQTQSAISGKGKPYAKVIVTRIL